MSFWGNGNKLKITALGGVEKVGEKNCVLLTHGKEGILFDCGQRLPRAEDDTEDLYPDFSGLSGVNLRGILISHAHMDHIGALGAVRERTAAPVIASSFTVKAITHHFLKGKEGAFFGSFNKNDEVHLGPFHIKRFPVLHSIPGSSGFVVSVDGKNVVYSGDIKTPGASVPASREEGYEIYTKALSEVGNIGVDALILDSTNIGKFGYAGIEERVYSSMRQAVRENPSGRIFISFVSSNITRMRNLMSIARRNNRKIYVAGYALRNFFHIAEIDGWHALDAGSARFMPDDAIVVVSGRQGEDGSFLSSLAEGSPDIAVEVQKRDVLVISSDTIPLTHIQEKFTKLMGVLAQKFGRIYTTSNVPWFERGMAETRRVETLHVSGHGKQEDIVRVLDLIHPKLLIPFHADREKREAMAMFARDRFGIESLILEVNKAEIL